MFPPALECIHPAMEIQIGHLIFFSKYYNVFCIIPVFVVDLFGATPFTNAPVQPAQAQNQAPFGAPSGGADPFGMGQFTPSTQDLDQQIMNVDRELLDLKVREMLVMA